MQDVEVASQDATGKIMDEKAVSLWGLESERDKANFEIDSLKSQKNLARDDQEKRNIDQQVKSFEDQKKTIENDLKQVKNTDAVKGDSFNETNRHAHNTNDSIHNPLAAADDDRHF